ncbi:uncharacterized protein LOC144282306 isoform X2 [Canis aureus]
MCPVFLQANNFIISSSKDEWIKKLWSMYTMEYSSAIRNDKYPPFASTWMELEGIMLSEWSCYLCSTHASPGGSSCLLLLLGIDGPCSHCTASSPPHGSMSTDSEGAGRKGRNQLILDRRLQKYPLLNPVYLLPVSTVKASDRSFQSAFICLHTML